MPSSVFEAGDQHGKAERIEPEVQQHEIVAQRRQNLAVLARDLLPSGPLWLILPTWLRDLRFIHLRDRYIPATITIKFTTRDVVNANGLSASPAIRCRQIDEGDIAAVAELLRRGFPNRSRQFWQHALGSS